VHVAIRSTEPDKLDVAFASQVPASLGYGF
jgi:hypothetical protein